MLRVEAEKLFKTDIINKLLSLDFIDGTNLAKGVIQTSDVSFWKNILDKSSASKNNSYIVYSIQPSTDNLYGDGDALTQRFSATLDLFSISKDESRNIYNLRKKIENEFTGFPWKIEFNFSEYDNDKKLNHYSYTVSSFYGG